MAVNVALPSFVLAYHGCDATVAEQVFAGKATLSLSNNNYDWLADGIYFWEHNAQRAYDWARQVSERPNPSGQKIKKPAVVGAVINLANCLNLLDSRFIQLVNDAYIDLEHLMTGAKVKMPANSGGPDRFNRQLDCAVIRFLHENREAHGNPPFDTVRAAFFEGEPLYENAGFARKSHIQICVRHHRNIVGYFRPLDEASRPASFA